MVEVETRAGVEAWRRKESGESEPPRPGAASHPDLATAVHRRVYRVSMPPRGGRPRVESHPHPRCTADHEVVSTHRI